MLSVWQYGKLLRVDSKPGGGFHVVVWCWWMSNLQMPSVTYGGGIVVGKVPRGCGTCIVGRNKPEHTVIIGDGKVPSS